MAMHRVSSFEVKTTFFATQGVIFQGECKSHKSPIHPQCITHLSHTHIQGFVFLLNAHLGKKYSTSTNVISSVVQNSLHKKEIVPASPPPKFDDLALLHRFIEDSRNLVVLTGAGVSTESGIPDYRSPNGAYSKGFKPMIHQEFVSSARNQRRYWARSYAGWRRFLSAQPGPSHRAIAQLEARGYIEGIITQNVDRLHHSAGSSPLELHGTTHEVICLNCGDLTSRHDFQERVKILNSEWASAVEALENGVASSDIGMQQRPDGDIEINESFWEAEFQVPVCQQCSGVLKPNVVFFGDNIPKSRADKAMTMVTNANALLVVGSSVMVLSAFRLAKAAYEKGIPLAILNIGSTRADHLASIKIQCRSGEILPRVLDLGSLGVPVA